MPRRVFAIVLVLLGWLLAAYIATNVRTDCPSATAWAVLHGEARCTAPIAYTITHPTPWWGFNHVFGPLLLIGLVIVPALIAAYFEFRLLRSTRKLAGH